MSGGGGPPPAESPAPPPRVTLGLPVYNGADYLRSTLESALAQTFTDFELIVSDNASTDDTASIVAELATVDPRVRYHRHPRNIGAHHNYNSLVPVARSRYFKWMAHDDLLAPRFLEACVAALDARPDVVLAFTATDRIDATGAKVGELVSTTSYEHDSPYRRLRAYVGDRVKSPQIFGVMRTATLRQTRLLGNYRGSDFTLLQELALRGRFAALEEHLFLYRFHEQRYSARPDAEVRAWYEPGRSAPQLSRWLELAGLLGAIRRVPMPPGDRLRCVGFTGRWAAAHVGGLAEDLTVRGRYELGRLAARLRRR